MSLLEWLAIAVTIVTVYALVKRYETRLVLFTAGFVLCLVSLDPISALNSFAKSMTNNSLVMNICSSMGFAFIASYTQCDRSLVHYLASPIRGLGVLLIPICTIVTFFINIALPSAAGCAAAVGSTLIPVMMRAGIKPAAAAAAVMGGTIGSFLSPGTSHNAFVAAMANIEVMEFIGFHAVWSILAAAIVVVGILLVCLVLGDHKGSKTETAQAAAQKVDDGFKPSVLKAIMTLIPITILVVGNVWVPAIKMGVAQAMVLGAVITLVVAYAMDRTNPQEFSKQFFTGMGKGYADVMGIIIAAGVFAAGLRATGLIDTFVDVLKHSNDIARWGGSLGPWIMGTITGSGDAATMAFNEAVTPHAPEFGMEIKALGALAFLTGALGRTMSPIAGAMVVVSGIAMANPMDVAKRTALPCTVAVFVLALFMV